MTFEKISDKYFTAAAQTEAVCLDTAWTESQIAAVSDDKSYAYYVALDGDVLCGVCSCIFSIDDGEILNLAVLPEKRRLGIAAALLDCVTREAEERGCQLLTLEVASKNGAAIALYASCGFVKAGLRRGFYKKQNDDAVIMTKEIHR